MGLLTRLIDRLARDKMEVGRPGDGVYLTRWVLFGQRMGPPGSRALFLHWFQRSDEDQLHDHPWGFISVILSGGYWEHTPLDPADPAGPTRRRWYGPGRVLVRPADWRHRVEIPDGRAAWTLILRGVKRRSWYFYCPAGEVPWRTYVARVDAGGAGCGEPEAFAGAA